MLYIFYLAVATLVVLLAIKASDYIDQIDKRSSLSGAFLGGVLLSAVTSLPELFTSISATTMLHKPGLCIGNILGSNIFNMFILGVMWLLFARSSHSAPLSRGHRFVLLYLLGTYVMVALCWAWPEVFDFSVLTLSISSIVIVALYALGVKYLSAEDGSDTQVSENSVVGEEKDLTMRQIVVRFVLCSICLVGLSIVLTYLSDELALRLNMGAGLAGALFLGVATSLPELASTVMLFRIRNYNVAVGNIVGSCLFNMIILTVADLLWMGGTVYDFSDPNVLQLLTYGSVALGFTYWTIASRKMLAKVVGGVCIVACYLAFLM